ncbi:MAG: D-alanyl-D-alanine carboxypeptidase/D-alanyl-D-alanine-endopeptidase [Solirubrobacteraceae bacterium]
MLTGLLGALAVAALILAGFGSLSAITDPSTTSREALPTAQRAHRQRAVSPSAQARPTASLSAGLAPAPPRTPAQLHVGAVLAKALDAAGPQSGALVYDLDTHQAVFARRAMARRPPASVEKIFTTVALMRVLGPNARLHTSVLGTGHLTGGVWHGDLYLRGGGDPTFGDAGFNRVWEQGYGSTANQLVADLARSGIRRVTGSLYADESLFDVHRGGLLTKLAPDTPDFGGQLSALDYNHGSALRRLSPARFAAKEFVLTMRSSGITIRAGSHTATTPPQAHMLATVDSPPLSVMARLMDVPSDDLFAELFTKQLGVLFGGGGTIADGAKVIGGTISAAFGLHPTIVDGSGLSRNDQSSPAEIVDLLRDVWHTPVGGQLAAALPTVGKEGTVQNIGLKTAARGRCIAKTGTLDYVTNLAGYCHTKTGRRLAFALFVDGPPNYAAIVLESRMIGAIGAY